MGSGDPSGARHPAISFGRPQGITVSRTCGRRSVETIIRIVYDLCRAIPMAIPKVLQQATSQLAGGTRCSHSRGPLRHAVVLMQASKS